MKPKSQAEQEFVTLWQWAVEQESMRLARALDNLVDHAKAQQDQDFRRFMGKVLGK